ncbi:ribosomal protein L4 [Coniochaeta ligniaria NRRL 30616]|uniref:Large ribosomal subunit protein uL4m n=1 Tax=Coniochaeta ligniaria NRRL 30616 TaxID=1408157 RepID=A0A1J7JJV7_9PEZI|nr:ribosomal protein L4 [Coniochaeta ligniaria NRRL 30616]
MAGTGVKGLTEALKAMGLSSQSCRTLPTRSLPSLTRTMATTPSPNITRSSTDPWTPISSVPLTIYAFPSLEPRSLESWSPKHLHLPLRRDILHQAVVFEGDATRQGTASTKTRHEVHGSHRKLYRQKGTGRARVGTKQSPLRRGGGKSFGPKPRDFSTGLNRKVYDLAWRTALSYRYRRGELIVTEDGMELPLPEEFLALVEAGRLRGVGMEESAELEDGFVRRYMRGIMQGLRWGAEHGRTTFVTGDRRPNLFTSLEVAGEEGRALELEDVDVKDLLETGRIVIEREALREMIKRHQSDLVSNVVVNGLRYRGPELGSPLVGA